MYLVKDILHYCNVSLAQCTQIESKVISYYDFTFVIEGEIIYSVNQTEYTLQPGDAIFLPPGTLRARHSGTTPVNFVSFNFLANEGSCFDFPCFMKNIISKEITDLISIFPKLHMYKYDFSKQKLAAVLNYILYELKHITFYGTTNPHVLKAIHYIDENTQKNISLSDVSRHLCLSKEYTSGIFKKAIGKTVNEYISEKKMLLAKEMILQGGSSLKKIAADLGYENYNYFSRRFRSFFEVSPAKYKVIF